MARTATFPGGAPHTSGFGRWLGLRSHARKKSRDEAQALDTLNAHMLRDIGLLASDTRPLHGPGRLTPFI